MSLINQMLQELDARRADASGSSPFGQQVRAVPERRRIHPAWWVALGAFIALASVISWLILRPAAPIANQVPAVELPLKFTSDLDVKSAQTIGHSPNNAGPSAAPVPTPVLPPIEPATTVVEPIPVVPVTPITPATQQVAQPTSQPTVQAVATQVQAPAAKQSPTRVEKQAMSVPATESANVSAPVKSIALPPAKSNESTEQVIGKQVKELTPQQRAESEYRKALQSLQLGRGGEAITGFEQALALDGHHAAARQALIGVLLENRRNDEAMKRAQDGLALDPSQSGLAMILGRLQLERGELRTAIDTLQRSLPHAVDRADYRATLAAMLQRDERHRQAAEQYLAALQKSPQNGVWWMGLGISLQAEQRGQEALEAFKRAKATNALSPELTAFVDSKISQLQR